MKRMIVLFLIGVFILNLTACQENKQWKDHIIGGFDNLLQSISWYALTPDGNLQGKRFQSATGKSHSPSEQTIGLFNITPSPIRTGADHCSALSS